MDKSKMNASGCADPTAYEAMNHITYEEKLKRDEEANHLIKEAKALIRSRGFDVIGRIGIKDKATGKEYR